MRNRSTVPQSLLPRVTFWLAIAAAVGEAAATLAANERIDVAVVAYTAALAAPLGILAWMSRRYRDRRILKLVLFLTVVCLGAWGLSHLIDDAWRYRNDPDSRKVQRWAPFIVLCGNWMAVVAMFWVERLLKRFSRRG
jgi:hypothetical protein